MNNLRCSIFTLIELHDFIINRLIVNTRRHSSEKSRQLKYIIKSFRNEIYLFLKNFLVILECIYFKLYNSLIYIRGVLAKVI
jgi:hypothetical protein